MAVQLPKDIWLSIGVTLGQESWESLVYLQRVSKFFLELVRFGVAPSLCIRNGCWISLCGTPAQSYEYFTQEMIRYAREKNSFWHSFARHERLRTGKASVSHMHRDAAQAFFRRIIGLSGRDVLEFQEGQRGIGLGYGWRIIASRLLQQIERVTLEKEGGPEGQFVLLDQFKGVKNAFNRIELLSARGSKAYKVLFRGAEQNFLFSISELDQETPKIAKYELMSEVFLNLKGRFGYIPPTVGCGDYVFTPYTDDGCSTLLIERIHVEREESVRFVLKSPFVWCGRLAMVHGMVVKRHEEIPDAHILCISYLASSESRMQCWILDPKLHVDTGEACACLGVYPRFMYGSDAVFLPHVVEEEAIRKHQPVGAQSLVRNGNKPHYVLCGDSGLGLVALVDLQPVSQPQPIGCLVNFSDWNREPFVVNAVRQEISSIGSLPLLRIAGITCPSKWSKRVSRIICRGDVAVVLIDCSLWILDLRKFQFLYNLDLFPEHSIDDSLVSLEMSEETIMVICNDAVAIVRLD